MDSRKKTPLSDRYLIAEQPGMAVLLGGLFFSFLCGYILKSYLSPARVTAQVEKAASHIHKDVRVRFASAQLSLSDGIFPRLAVVINDVKMVSDNKCWAAPVLEVDELRLPLSVWSLLRGRSPVLRVEAENVQLILRETVAKCSPQEEKKASATGPAPLVSLSPSEQETKYENSLRSVFVRDFKIVAEQYPQFSSEFLQFAVNVKSFEPKVIEVRAKTQLLKDQQVGDYLSHANLFIQYQESPQTKIQSHFFGNWREGHYSLIASFLPDESLLSVEADLKHIPLSQILSILQKYNLASKELNGRQAWLSSKARFSAPIDQLRRSPLEVSDLRLEGDLGEMKVDQLMFTSLDPLAYAPISVDIRKLDVEKLLVLLNRPETSSMLGHLGVFTGRAEIRSDQNIKISGEHKGLEFVFSNKGQRELQVVEHMVGDVALTGDRWNFAVRRMEPLGGAFLGELKVTADRDFSDVTVKARVDELSLAPAVQKLMTSGGSIGSLNLDVDARMKQGRVDFLKGLARMDGLEIEGLAFGKAKSAMDWSHGEVVFSTQVKSLEVTQGYAGSEVLRSVTMPSWWTKEHLSMHSLSGTFATKGLKEFSWKNVQGQIGKTGKFVTDGAWDEKGSLKGSVHNRDGKSHRRWIIEGNRESPAFVEDTLSANSSRK